MLTGQRVGTRIVATLGPATSSVESVEALVRAGTDVFRLNFSHGTPHDHQGYLQAVRTASQRLDRPAAVMGDLSGPKVRVLEVDGGLVELVEGQAVRLVPESVMGSAERLSVSIPEVLNEVEVDHRVLIDDGNVRLRVSACDGHGVDCICEVGGPVRSRKGVNLPDSDLSLPSLTEKDLADLKWSAVAGLDYLALSFVRRAADVTLLRQHLVDLNGELHIVAKIETPQAVNDLDDIIRAADAVLVARGDLGVELDVATVPRIQKDITRRCSRAGKPVIVATQMLQSMVHSPVPTRAEVSDVANAIYDGADAVMLSAETAVGRYPTEAVGVLRRVAAETEVDDGQGSGLLDPNPSDKRAVSAVARGLCRVAADIDAKAVVIWAETGRLARLVSKHRLDRPVVALAASEQVQRRVRLYYGIEPVLVERADSADALIYLADRVATGAGWVGSGDRIVIGFGPRSLSGGETGSIIIHTVEDQ